MTSQSKMVTGTYILYNGTVYAEVEGDISEPPFTIEKVPTTTHDDGGHASKIPGESEDGDLRFKMNFVNDTAQAALRVLARAKTTGMWQLVYPRSFGSLGYEIPGFISNLSKSLPQKGSVPKWDIAITPTSTVTERTTAAANLTNPFLDVIDEDSVHPTPTPAYAAAVYAYDHTMLQAVTANFTITPTATTGTIYVDGTIVATGAPSGAIGYTLANFPTGSIKTVFVVVTEATKVPTIYRLRFTRGTA